MSFLETKYLYFILLLFSMAYPLAQSFEHRISYYKKWKRLAPAILLVLVVFIPWDVWFTHKGVWWFNDRYITGFKIFLLPIEEWLFFVIVPFSCIFIYEVLNYFIKKDLLIGYADGILKAIFIFLVVVGAMHYDKTYTIVAFGMASVGVLYLIWSKPDWRGRFLMMYAVSWIPFLLVNGALTGTFTTEATVNYSPDEIIGFRILTIPIEDSIYNLFMLIITIVVYEKGKISR